MIHIEIVKAPDPNLLGNYEIHKNMVYIGSSHISDIFCPETELNDIHFFIEIADGKLILQLNKGTEFVLVNSKRTTTFKNLSKGNLIEAADIKFKIVDFAPTEIISRKEKLNSIVSTLGQDNPELLALITELNKGA